MTELEPNKKYQDLKTPYNIRIQQKFWKISSSICPKNP